MPDLEAEVELLTARDRGAIGVLRIRGRDAIRVADSVFRARSGASLDETPRNHLRLGRVGDGLGDEVVAVVLGTELPTVEFQCHGGVMPVALVTRALAQAGGHLVDQSFTLSGLGRLEQDAVADLAHATTVATAQVLLEQSQGALRDAIVTTLENIEVNSALALESLRQVVERTSYGLRLLRGWRVVLAGRPNVGKSRLLNALAGYQRAIVDSTPGTTRDAVSVKAALGGWPVEIIDTAGLRLTEDDIERQGVERSHNEQLKADLVLLVVDRSDCLMKDDLALVDRTPDGLVVASKVDLPAEWDSAVAFGERPIVEVSAQAGTGLETLISTIIGRLVPRPPEKGTGVPFRKEHHVALLEALRLIERDDARTARSVLESLLR
jgi:tRNA modification GTPase